MGLLDGAMGAMGGGLDLGTLAGRFGLTEEQVRGGIAALATAANEHGDTVQLAAAKTGLPLDKLAALLAGMGGEAGVSAAAGAINGGSGLGGALGGLLNR